MWNKILSLVMDNPVLTLIIVNLLFYGRTLSYGLIIDDIDAFNAQVTKRTTNFWKNIWLQFKQEYSGNPAIGHLFSIIMHTINTILVYYLFGANDISFLTALLFCINPVGNMASTWLSGRTYSISTTLVLTGLMFPILFPIAYYFTFAWSINAFMSPLLFLFLGFPLLAGVLPCVAFLNRRRYLGTVKLRLDSVPDRMKKPDFKKLILVPKTFAYYFILCLFPYRLGMCHSYLHTFGLSEEETNQWFKLDKFFWLGLGILTSIGLCIYSMGIAYSFGLIWFCLFILQWCNYIVINHPITERYAYLANIGLMYFLAQNIINTPVAIVALTAYAILNLKYIPAYKDCLSYWKSNTDNFPDVAMGYNQYGIELNKIGKIGTAFDVWLQGKMYRQNDFRINYNIANMLMTQGRWDIIKDFIIIARNNICKINGTQFWTDKIDELQRISEQNGVRFDITPEEEEAIKKQKETDVFVHNQEVNDLNSLQSKPFLHMKYKPDYVKFLEDKYKVKFEGVEDGTIIQGPTSGSEATGDTGAGGNTI